MIIPAIALALLWCLGQSCARIYDPLCVQTGRKCGHNMVYRTVDKMKYTDDVSPELICIQECTCISEQYERKDGQCIEKNDILTRNEVPIENLFKEIETTTTTSTQRFVTKEFSAQITAQKSLPKVPTSKACSGRICALDEIITDILCSLTDQKCGPNMAFKTIVGPLYMKVGISSYKICIQQCICDSNEYTKMGGQCIKKSSAPMRNETEFAGEILPKHCAGRVCALDEEIYKVPCSLTGEVCGTNMIFNNIGKLLKKNGTVVCFQKCTCVSEEYVKANGQCILSTKGNETATPTSTQRSAKGNESVAPTATKRSGTEHPQFPIKPTIQQHPETRAKCVGRSCEQIRDPFCKLAGRKCGDNMVYKTIERLIRIDDTPEMCIQQCKCVSKKYTEKGGRCIIRERSVKKNHAQVTLYCTIIILKFAKFP
ncbi:unnamed protein product [Dracunculus medinensis]|uniref:Conserved secreted protein n=1 Tax=Dracunculus medinensis TaxID=318479 RepID=A0A0N4URE7_DRAME|nr:unnamed protein product [Dracunculus medinensis]